jgi:hypothetical protein
MNVFALVRAQRCRKAGCTHDLALCQDPAASCAQAGWGAIGGMPAGIRQAESLPSLPRMAANFATAHARDLLAGRPRRDEGETARLRGICESCEHLRSDRRCSLCGCPVVDKIVMAREQCPVGKW